MTHIVAISNNKGGVAKTTTCLSLGACLAGAGHRTLVVDLDPQADLTLAAGLDAEALALSIVDVLRPAHSETLDLHRVVLGTDVEGLDILPSDPRLASVERFLYEQVGYEMTLARIFESMNSMYTYILLDCPPSLGGLTLMALTAARWVIIPVQCEYYAARRLLRLLDVVAAVRVRTNPDLSCYLLATMYDQRTRIGKGVLEQLKLRFPDRGPDAARLLDTVIGVDTRLRECPAAGEPITLYAPRTRASRQYHQLAREFHLRVSSLQKGRYGASEG
jgi:chromosome partitioning protein